MDKLTDLYHDLILDHGRNPRNYHQIDKPTHTVIGDNPLCGDRIELFVRIASEKIEDVGFKGQGCAVCLASASVMTEEIKNQSLKNISLKIKNFREFLINSTVSVENYSSQKQKVSERLAIFQGVRTSPMRVKCALLPWYVLAKGLGDK